MRFKTAGNIIIRNSGVVLTLLLTLNFILRIVIWSSATLFRFADYASYLEAIERIEQGSNVYLLNGNFLYAISYAGWFFKYVMGSIDLFFIFNSLVGTAVSYIIYLLVVNFTGNIKAGLIMILLHTVYTEFMVFSSVFYTPVIMLFLVSLFLLFLYKYYHGKSIRKSYPALAILVVLFLLTFFFKPELKYLPLFLLGFSVILFISSHKLLGKRTFVLGVILLTAQLLLSLSGVISRPPGHVYANDFVFFGHTDYGGDGGEGSFVYAENKEKYEAALADYCERKGIEKPDRIELNDFQRAEIIRFIKSDPAGWIALQAKKFFRTFGVVPESTSFRILYTGLLKGNLWPVAIVTVAPVAMIIILFILLFAPDRFIVPGRANKEFIWIFLLVFGYYLTATVFYGHYQERYRLPLMVLFIIPTLSIFIAGSGFKQRSLEPGLLIKGMVITLFLTVWVFQTVTATGNRERLERALNVAEQNAET